MEFSTFCGQNPFGFGTSGNRCFLEIRMSFASICHFRILLESCEYPPYSISKPLAYVHSDCNGPALTDVLTLSSRLLPIDDCVRLLLHVLGEGSSNENMAVDDLERHQRVVGLRVGASACKQLAKRAVDRL